MPAKKPTVKTKLQQKADKSNKILTGPKGSKPQSTTNTRLMKQGDKTTKSGNYTVGRTEYNNGRLTNAAKPDGTMKRNRRGSGAKGTPSTPSGGGKNLFGGAGDKNTAIKQAGPKAPKPAFKPAKTPFSSPPAVGQTARDLAKAQGQAAVKNAQQRRANLARVQQNLRGQVGRAASILTGPAGKARQAIYESVAPRPTSTRANLKEGLAAAKATMKAKAKSADSFGGQYQKPNSATKRGMVSPRLSKAKSFDNAFASARNSGMKTFVWEGKRYNTKMRGEK